MEQIPENTVVLDNVQRRRINILCKGTYELRPAVGKTYKMRHEFSSPWLNKCTVASQVSASCESHADRKKCSLPLPKRSRRKPAVQRGIQRIHPPTHRHHPTSSVRCFLRPRIPEFHGFPNLFYVNLQTLRRVNCLLQPFCVLWYKILSVSSSINPSIQKLIHT